MSDAQILSGGAPTRSEVLVNADQSTILGDGSVDNPLRTVGGGTSVVTDGTSVAGTGTLGDPLHTVDGGTPVATDGVTITGDGTTGSPLAVAGPRVIAAAVVNANATFVAQQGFATLGVGLPGDYTLALANPPADYSQVLVVATLRDNAGEIRWAVPSSPDVSIQTLDSAGSLSASGFSIVVYDLTST